MIDMSYEINEQKDFSLPAPKPKYPHGLKIYLSPVELEKLNISGVPEVDKEFKAEIVMVVTSVSKEDGEGNEDKHRVELQIKEMELKKDKKEDGKMDASQIIYGD